MCLKCLRHALMYPMHAFTTSMNNVCSFRFVLFQSLTSSHATQHNITFHYFFVFVCQLPSDIHLFSNDNFLDFHPALFRATGGGVFPSYNQGPLFLMVFNVHPEHIKSFMSEVQRIPSIREFFLTFFNACKTHHVFMVGVTGCSVYHCFGKLDSGEISSLIVSLRCQCRRYPQNTAYTIVCGVSPQ